MYLPIKLQNGKVFHVDVQAEPAAPAGFADPGLLSAGPGMGGHTASALAEKNFGDAVQIVQGIATEVTVNLIEPAESTAGSKRRLAEVELELELGFDASGKVLIFAEASAHAALKLTLKWKLD